MPEQNRLQHIGTKRHSGRYPWGSGKNPYQSESFLQYVKDLKRSGMSDTEIAKKVGLKRNELVERRSILNAQKLAADQAMATRLKDKGYSNVAIGKRMNINESTVRTLLDPARQDRLKINTNIANTLRTAVDEHGYIDIGKGTETIMGVSKGRLKTAVRMLKDEGYTTHYINVEQIGTGKKTSVVVLAGKDVDGKEVYANKHNVRVIFDRHSDDLGRSFDYIGSPKNPKYLSDDRVMIRYREDGGAEMDGVIQLRRGVEDISLGNAKYAQVRIGVNGTHFMKGMAMYTDDLPDGVDIIYNSNKSKSVGKMDTMKLVKKGDFPFGAVIRPREYTDTTGSKKEANVYIVNEEGDWKNWSKSLSSQLLSKQLPKFAKQQLDHAYLGKKAEYDEIMRLTNPVVKERLLESFADSVDSSSVTLKAAGLPRQAWAAILPFSDMKETEIYAPNHRPGERVALVRFPHGGTFEIPELTVNNKHPRAKDLIGNAKDAIGINPKVAKRLSGADFDGDTVLVIPNNKGEIKTSPSLKGLENFDPITAYPYYPGMKKMTKHGKGLQMGGVSNLITDMTIGGAPPDEIARAVRHSMVVIDAEKHGLNYEQSFIDNGISALKKRYQGGANRGASTIISRAKGEKRVPQRDDTRVDIDPLTGKKIHYYTKKTYVDKQGKTQKLKTKSTQMLETDDASSLSSGTIMESVYVNHANKLKALANRARKSMVNTKPRKHSKSADKAYAEEVGSLKAKLREALRNKPYERQAHLIGNKMLRDRREAMPDMTREEYKKVKNQTLLEARYRVGAKKKNIKITTKEWRAIQAGALSNTVLRAIMYNADMEVLRTLATPRSLATVMVPAKQRRAKALLASGYTQSEVADALGVALSTLTSSLDA